MQYVPREIALANTYCRPTWLFAGRPTRRTSRACASARGTNRRSRRYSSVWKTEFGPREHRGRRVRPPPRTHHGEYRRTVQASRRVDSARAAGHGLRDSAAPGGDGAYVDFLGDDGQARIREAYPGATCERLVAVKQRYDPTNLFRLNHNVQQTDWRVEPHSLIIGAPQADLAELPFSPLARPAGGAGRMCQSAYPGPDRLTKVPERLPRFIPRADLERLMVAI